jgi:tetratricopeptide (TPR) repeat protein
MRRLALLLCSLSCAEWGMAPTFPRQAAERPVVHEQALLGLSQGGAAAVVELVDAEGEPPRLSLLAWGGPGGSVRTLLTAPADRAQAVANRIREEGGKPLPLLADAVQREWPEAPQAAAAQGYAPSPEAKEDAADCPPESRCWPIEGALETGKPGLVLRIARTEQPATVLLLSDGLGSDEIELARMPLSGASAGAKLWVRGEAAWMLAGSVAREDPLRRAIGMRRASLRRGEAELHNLHGLQEYAATDLDAARREFDRAIAADPGFLDGLYNAASTAALEHRVEEAVALLRRAAAIDPARVQVLGRNDEDLRSLRERADVRALLGLRRLPPEGVPPPP